MKTKLILASALAFLSLNTQAQNKVNTDTVTFGRFDNGKMWTFDNPPLDYFQQTYNFRPTQEWLDDVQMSALRFATYCSASFVSAEGLVMTNHHCARESGTAVQLKGEDLSATGFYAKTLAEERKVPGLFVDQLVKRQDITAQVNQTLENIADDKQEKVKDSLLAAIKKQYQQNADWKDLELQVVSFYKGGKYSLQGFKRYKDVRLVFMPELQLGFFGGDPDNFTYPRYALDCSFFRVYDENGKPFKPNHYFKFNPAGAKAGEAVFVVGNPGRTDRLATSAQLDFFKDQYFPFLLETIRSRADILHKYNETAKIDSLTNEVFSLENSFKALSGQYAGLKDPYIVAKKKAFEKDFYSKVEQNPKLKVQTKLWTEISDSRQAMRSYFPTTITLGPRDWNAEGYNVALSLAKYAHLLTEGKDTSAIKKAKEELLALNLHSDKTLEAQLLAAQLKEAHHRLNNKLFVLFEDKTVESTAALYINESKLYNKDEIKNLVNGAPESILKSTDPLILLGTTAYRDLKTATDKADSLIKKEAALTAKLARLQFEIYGEQFPPDANFSLRLADGTVKGFDYNGTTAPVKTTFYGLYDRYYSNEGQYPWSLPKRWENPSKELLQSSINFVSTNDIIGGNSGSPMININKEVVGLIFDGNIESLPGRFIFLETKNRTVSVHAGGMYAALKYVYKANRIVKELDKR